MAPRASRSRAQTVPLVPAAASSQSALLGMIPPYIVSTSTTMDPRVDDVDLSMLNYVPMLQSREEQQSADHGTASTLSARPLDYFFLRASAEASANDDVSEIWQMDGYFGGWNQQQQHLDSEHSMNTDTCGDSAGMSVTTTTSRSASPPRDRTQSAASSSAVTVTSQVSVESVAKIAESIEAVRREKRRARNRRAAKNARLRHTHYVKDLKADNERLREENERLSQELHNVRAALLAMGASGEASEGQTQRG